MRRRAAGHDWLGCAGCVYRRGGGSTWSKAILAQACSRAVEMASHRGRKHLPPIRWIVLSARPERTQTWRERVTIWRSPPLSGKRIAGVRVSGVSPFSCVASSAPVEIDSVVCLLVVGNKKESRGVISTRQCGDRSRSHESILAPRPPLLLRCIWRMLDVIFTCCRWLKRARPGRSRRSEIACC